jgi:hypothetical protein
MRLSAGWVAVPEDVIERAVARTAGVSTSFIKELMRRSAQFTLERGASQNGWADVDVASALWLFAGAR